MATPDRERLSPYQGLIPYNEGDAPFFFGRDKEIRLIIANLFASPLTLLYGASGVGKSSVLHAGAVHQLRGRDELLVIPFSAWQGNPLTDLVQAVADYAEAADRAGWRRVVAAMEKAHADGAPLTLAELLAACHEQTGRRLMIVLDQFEEYFLYHPQDDAFAEEFPKAVLQPEAPVSFLISIREDALAKLDRFEGRIPGLFDNYLRIEHLGYEAARESMTRPLEEFNKLHADDPPVAIEPELVNAVLEQVQTGQVILGESGHGRVKAGAAEAQIETPFLQMVMTRLWDEELRAGSRVLRLETLKGLGNAEDGETGAARIVRTHLDEKMNTLPADEQAVAAGVYHHLVTPSGTKIAHTIPDLAAYARMPREQLAPVMEKLAHHDFRILRGVAPPPDHPDEPRYEIFHDVLSAAVLDWRARYAQAQERAEAEKQLALAAAEQMKTERQLARERTLVSRLRYALVGLVLLIMLMSVVTVWAFQQRQTAVEHQETALLKTIAAEQSKAEADEQRQAAEGQRDVAYAARQAAEAAELTALDAQLKEAAQREKTQHALDTARTAIRNREIADKNREIAESRRKRQETINQLRTELEAASGPLETHPESSLSLAKAVLEGSRELDPPDEETSKRAEDVLRRALFTLEDSRDSKVLSGHTDSVEGAYYSPTGGLLVTTGAEGGARVWDTLDWKVRKLPERGGPVRKVVFNGDGSRFLTQSGEDTILVWDRNSLDAPAYSLQGRDAVFGADGRTVFLTNKDGEVHKATPDKAVSELVPHATPPPSGHSVPREKTWINSDGTLALSATQEPKSKVRVWEVGTQRPELELPVGGQPEGVVFGPLRHRVAVFAGERVQVFDLDEWSSAPLPTPTPAEAGQPPPAEESPSPTPPASPSPTPEFGVTLTIPSKSAVTRAEFRPDGGNGLLTLSADGTTMLWNLSEKKGVQVLQGQTADVINAVFSPDGQYVLLLDSRGTARAWSVEERAVFVTLRGHDGPILSAAFSPSGDSLVTASYDGTARLWPWQPRTWRAKPPDTFGGRGGDEPFVRTATFSQDASEKGGSILFATNKGALVVNSASGEEPAFPGDTPTFSADGRLVAVAGKETVAQLADAGTGQPRLGLSGHTDEVRGAAFSRDGRYVLTAGADGTARVWDVTTGSAFVLGGHDGGVLAAFFSDDAKLVVTVGRDGKARVWQWQTEEGRARPVITTTRPDGTFSARMAAVSPDGNLVATTPGGSQVAVWEARTGRLLTTMRGFRARIRSVVFGPDSRRLLAVEDYGARLLDLSAPLGPVGQGQELNDKTRSDWARGLPARGAAFSPDGRFVVTAGGSMVQVWDVSKAKQPRRVAFDLGANERYVGAAFSPKGNYIAAAGGKPDAGVLHLWEAPEASRAAAARPLGKEAALLPGMPYPTGSLFSSQFRAPSEITFSEDEKFVFVSDNEDISAVWEWQSEAGSRRPVFVRGRVAALSPDGRTVFSSWEAPVVRIHETRTAQGTPFVIREIKGNVAKLAMSPDGGTVAGVVSYTGGDDPREEVWFWDSKSGLPRPSARLPGDRVITRILAFSPDGRLLAVAGGNDLKVFKAENGQEVPPSARPDGSPVLHKAEIKDVEFSPDGNYVVTASADRTARVWDVGGGQRLTSVSLLRGHFGEVTGATFSRDGKLIVTASADKTARVWQWQTPEQPGAEALAPVLARLEGHAGPVLAATFDREQRFVLTGSADNTARLWNARTGQVLAELVGHGDSVGSVQFSPDGKAILTVGADGAAHIYNCPQCGPLDELLTQADGRLRQGAQKER